MNPWFAFVLTFILFSSGVYVGFWGTGFHFLLLPSSAQSHSLQAQISTEIFQPATLSLALLNSKLAENQMKKSMAGDKTEKTLSN